MVHFKSAGATEAGNTVSKGKNIGTDFAEFPGEEGLLEDAQAVAIKRVVAWQLDQLMKRQGMTKVELARRMNTSRAALDRLLDPENPSVTLHTLHSAAKAVGGRLNVSLEVPGG
jgi:DNA-binding Xre family transcriptional regulator